MSRLYELIAELCPNGGEFHVFIMDKYIQSMVCLQIKQLPLLLRNKQKNKNLLK